MLRSTARMVAALMCLPLSGQLAREALPSRSLESMQDDRSPYLGRPVTDPEALSGIWEAPDGHGGAVGIHLQLITTIPGDAKTLNGTPQSWQSLELGVYERASALTEDVEQNGFSDSPRGGNLSFEGGHLRVHFPPIDLDLFQGPGDLWSGRFHRGSFDSRVVLRRPRPVSSSMVRWIVGTWSAGSSAFPQCIHVVQQADSNLAGWADSVVLLGLVRMGNNIQRPLTAIQIYGSLVKVQAYEHNKASFVFNAFGGICCPRTLSGSFAPEQKLFQGGWYEDSVHPRETIVWKKVAGESCFGPAQTSRSPKG